MGVIYKARNVTIDQIVAIKMIQAGSLDDRHVQRFKQEAAALASLDHYNIVKVNDFGFTDEAQPYMVLEYVHGQTLPQYLASRQGLVNLDTMRDIFMQITDALGYAHERGVLHRDLKPSNIMLQSSSSNQAVVKIVDFGIAKFLTADKNSALTQTGELLGSPSYMSPEQISGLPQDARADIYSLGCVMFEVLSGTPPYQAETPMDMIFQHLNADVPSLQARCKQKIPQQLAAIVTKCLQKEPHQRFNSMTELHSALLEVSFREREKSQTIPIKKVAVYASALVMLVVSGCLIAGIYLQSQRAEEKSLEAQKKSIANAVASRDSDGFQKANDFVRQYIKHHKNDVELCISDNCTDDALIEFTEGDANSYATRTILLGESDIKGPGLAYLIRIPIRRLEMQRSSLTDRGLLEISKMKTLQTLVLDGIRVSQSAWRYLQQLPNLNVLSVRNVDLDDEGLAEICKISSLEKLQTDDNPRITDSGYAQLLQSKHLDMLGTRSLKVTNSFIKTLVQMRALHTLYLNESNVTDAQLKLLSASKSLAEIELEKSPNITINGVKYLVSMPKIGSIDLRGNAWLKNSDLEVFKAINHDFHLSVEKTNITDEGMKTIAQTKCFYADISKTRVTDKGLLDLAQSKNIRVIRFSVGGDITQAGVRRLHEVRPDIRLDREISGANLI